MKLVYILFNTLSKYGHGELNIRRPYITDIVRYTSFSCVGEKIKWQSVFEK